MVEAPPFVDYDLPDIYPLGAEAVVAVIRPVLKSRRSLIEYIDIKTEVLQAENQYANGYLMSLVNEMEDPKSIDLFTLGVIFAYEVYKERAGGEPLPILTMEFVEDYFTAQNERQVKLYADDEEGQDAELGLVKSMFAMAEHKAYKALEQEVMKKGKPLFFDPLFLGFMNSYFLFAEGFNDPMNWEE
jgi:hypothetical protein